MGMNSGIASATNSTIAPPSSRDKCLVTDAIALLMSVYFFKSYLAQSRQLRQLL